MVLEGQDFGNADVIQRLPFACGEARQGSTCQSLLSGEAETRIQSMRRL